VNAFDGADDAWVIESQEEPDSVGRSRRQKPRKNYGAGGNTGSRFKEVEPGSLDLDAAREAGLRVLTRTQKSIHELEQALIKKGATAETASTVAQRFVEVELLDDARLAKGIVNTRVALKGESARAIRRELDRRGLSAQADTALAELDRDAEFENASELAISRMRRLGGLDRETRMRRLSSFLARKGYSGDVIGRAIRNAEAQAKIEI
jgi:regulatory protein